MLLFCAVRRSLSQIDVSFESKLLQFLTSESIERQTKSDNFLYFQLLLQTFASEAMIALMVFSAENAFCANRKMWIC